MDSCSTEVLGGSRAERRKRWFSFEGEMGGSEEAFWGGRRVEMDQVGLERRDSTFILVEECQVLGLVAGLDGLDDLDDVVFWRCPRETE